jgi:hypothetical protein
MIRPTLWFSMLLAFALTSGCKVEEDFPRNTKGYLKSGIDITVFHPEDGYAEHLVVKLYFDQDKLDANEAAFTTSTLPGGLARFREVPFGTWWVDCRVPGTPNAYAAKEIYIDRTTILTDRLNLVLVP